MGKGELLSPAGDLEKLKFAIKFGADALYLGGKEFSLRSSAANFTLEEMGEGIDFAHREGIKVYVAVNIIPHNDHLLGIKDYLKELAKLKPDGLIVADPSVIELAKKGAPDIPLHLSTQASATNWKSIRFWKEQGISRVILARELSLEEIRKIREKVDIELECFVHGAMCISYSGRCLLSNYLAHRDANLGECAHPCRWKYFLMEEKRPGEYHPLFENGKGTYIFNSRDLCLIEYIPQLLEAGVNSFKIEGRIKGVNYVATVTRAYRQVLDSYLSDPSSYQFDPGLMEELKKVSHRPYTTGFLLGKPGEDDQIYQDSSYIREYDFTGIVRDYNGEKGTALVEQRNNFGRGDRVEFFTPSGKTFIQEIEGLYTLEGEKMERAPHPQQLLVITTPHLLEPYTIMRRPRA